MSEVVGARIAALCKQREAGQEIRWMPDDMQFMFRFFDEFDPLSTRTGDHVGKLFPEVLTAYIDASRAIIRQEER